MKNIDNLRQKGLSLGQALLPSQRVRNNGSYTFNHKNEIYYYPFLHF